MFDRLRLFLGRSLSRFCPRTVFHFTVRSFAHLGTDGVAMTSENLGLKLAFSVLSKIVNFLTFFQLEIVLHFF